MQSRRWRRIHDAVVACCGPVRIGCAGRLCGCRPQEPAAVLGGILICTCLGSLLLAAFLRMTDGPALQRWLHVPLDAFGLSFYALLAGTPAALVFGLPVYAWLQARGWASWRTVTAIALVPAVLALPTGIDIAGLVAEYALCVAWITHALRLRFTRAGAAPVRGA